MTYRWTVEVSEEEPNWGNPEINFGETDDLAEAKTCCCDALLSFLFGEGYTANEIAESLQRGAGGSNA